LADHATFIQRESYVFEVVDGDGLGAVAAEDEAVGAVEDGPVAVLGVEAVEGGVEAEVGHGAPGAFEPVAVLVGHIPLLLPLGARREELRVVGHVELASVLEAPAVGAVVAEQDAVAVELGQDL
jgi:hypothetical protein